MTDNAGYAARRERDQRAVEHFEFMIEMFIMGTVALAGFCFGMVYGTLW